MMEKEAPEPTDDNTHNGTEIEISVISTEHETLPDELAGNVTPGGIDVGEK